MTCSIRLAARPPYSLGQESPTHPAPASFRCHARRFSNTSRLGAIRSSIASSIHSSCGRFSLSQVRTSLRKASCSGVNSKSMRLPCWLRCNACDLVDMSNGCDLVQVKCARGIIPKNFALALGRNRLVVQLAQCRRPGAVGMRIVGVPQKIVIAAEFDHRLKRTLVTTARDEEVAVEVFAGLHPQFGMLGVATELPMLLHPLQPVRNPSAVGLDMHDREARELLEHAEPDETRHRRHRLERMRQDVTARMRVHPLAERRQAWRGSIMDRDRLV